MFPDLPSDVLVWAAIALAGVVALIILVSLLSSEEEAPDDVAGAEVPNGEIPPDGEEVPIELRQLAVLYRIDRKLRAVHVMAILMTIGWFVACLAVAIGLALGPTVLVGDLLRRLLR